MALLEDSSPCRPVMLMSIMGEVSFCILCIKSENATDLICFATLFLSVLVVYLYTVSMLKLFSFFIFKIYLKYSVILRICIKGSLLFCYVDMGA